MTLIELKKQLETLGLPIAYHHFAEGSVPRLPYLVYYSEGSDNFSADGIVYQKNDELIVEVYTSNKNPILEKKVEDLFTKNEIFFNNEEIYIESEKMYLIRYEITL